MSACELHVMVTRMNNCLKKKCTKVNLMSASLRAKVSAGPGFGQGGARLFFSALNFIIVSDGGPAFDFSSNYSVGFDPPFQSDANTYHYYCWSRSRSAFNSRFRFIVGGNRGPSLDSNPDTNIDLDTGQRTLAHPPLRVVSRSSPRSPPRARRAQVPVRFPGSGRSPQAKLGLHLLRSNRDCDYSGYGNESWAENKIKNGSRIERRTGIKIENGKGDKNER
ncbi:hypothetical protein EVAR_101796_1 [Eumeta japonica]|uniref:Uncharacterized protein n=1 Tax=Eumeta variegata TaxID=151549 RepID=A0A4C1SQU1_EUMVA|nr:hypothetical protein EVAR_101796_1 [Eumeta japonica]